MPSDVASRRAAALSPIDPDRGGRRTDPAEPGIDRSLREVRALGEEPEAGMDRVRAGALAPPQRRRRRRAGPGRRTVRLRGRWPGSPSRSHVRAIRAAISPRLAMKSVRIGRRRVRACRSAVRSGAVNASIASLATRHRPPTRLAGSSHSRSSAGPSASSSRAAPRPALGSVRRACCRDCRVSGSKRNARSSLARGSDGQWHVDRSHLSWGRQRPRRCIRVPSAPMRSDATGSRARVQPGRPARRSPSGSASHRDRASRRWQTRPPVWR